VSDPVVVDARGQRCPLPVIALARRARDLPPGAVLVVLATDPAARHDVPAWARMRGHETVGIEAAGDDHWRLTVRLGPAD
jgi:tRNA 2-thiouridine synthesizing protein A